MHAQITTRASAYETMELFAFLEAADGSKRQGGAKGGTPVTIVCAMDRARK